MSKREFKSTVRLLNTKKGTKGFHIPFYVADAHKIQIGDILILEIKNIKKSSYKKQEKKNGR